MNEIGRIFKETREEAGVTISEASKDLDIKEVILENIEDGNIGCFKDIFVLKDYIYSYSKYLGIDADKTIDNFNEYMFEYTSRIPIEEIEKKMQEQNAKSVKNEVISPYTKVVAKQNKSLFILLFASIILLSLFIVFLTIKKVIVNNNSVAVISYVK